MFGSLSPVLLFLTIPDFLDWCEPSKIKLVDLSDFDGRMYPLLIITKLFSSSKNIPACADIAKSCKTCATDVSGPT